MPARTEFHVFFRNLPVGDVFDSIQRVFNSAQSETTMRRNDVWILREQTAHRAQILASIGRGLRERHDAAQPMPNRLANLVKKIEQGTSECDRTKGGPGT